MKRLLSAAMFCFILVVSGIAAQAQQKTMLWKVSGKGLSKPSYLFGTLHVMCPEDFKISTKAAAAFQESSKLVLEVDLSDPTELQKAQQLMITEKTLSSQLNETERVLLDSSLSKHLQIRLSQVDRFSLLALQSMMVSKAITCPQPKMYEMELIGMAKNQNKTIGRLESIEDQFSAIDKSFTARELAAQLQLVPEYKSLFAGMVNDYKNEDLDALEQKLLDKRFITDEAIQHLLTERNARWVTKMPGMMDGKQVFFAVGASHLAGKNGLIHLLRKDGYTVTPLF